jgi:hypothetical protein
MSKEKNKGQEYAKEKQEDIQKEANQERINRAAKGGHNR